MSDLIVTVMKVGYLALLWLLVLAAIGVLRRDVFGTRVLARGSVVRQSKSDGGARPSRRVPRGGPTRLRVTAGPLNGTTLALGSSAILIGRAPGSTLVLDDDYCSNRHARIFFHDGRWWLEDLGSRNGTYLGSAQVTDPVPVDTGVPIRLGQTVLELQR